MKERALAERAKLVGFCSSQAQGFLSLKEKLDVYVAQLGIPHAWHLAGGRSRSAIHLAEGFALNAPPVT